MSENETMEVSTDICHINSLLSNQQKYMDLFDISPMPTFFLNQHGIINEVNAAGAKLLGVDRESLIDKNFSRYVAPDFQQEFVQYKKRLPKKMQPQICELKLLQRFSPLFYARIIGRPTCSQNGELELLLMVDHAGNRKRMDDVFRSETDSTALLGNHMFIDLNQSLSIIANYIYGCIRRLENEKQEHSVLPAMRQAEHELHRIAEIIIRMKNFSIKGLLKPELVIITTMIDEIVDMMNHEIMHFPVFIQRRPAKGLPKLLLDRMYIQQAILNLARNSIEAMMEAGTIDPKLIIEINRPSTELLEIIILDNGPGFDVENVHQLFDPHYTTKTYGIGLGLIISRIIVESHGGKILADVNPAGGSIFTIMLPIHISE